MLTFGSLFAGIGGFDLGLERAGMRSVWQCEIDPYCIRVLEKHWPDVLRVRDIRELGADTVPAVDVICGGFPCQDLSYAGKGAGIEGERSGLWSEYARVVGELRPRYVVVENVQALLARGLGRVLGDLAALGYDAEWDCIPASAVGAPHRRDRVWLVAYPQRDDGRQGRQGRSAASGQGQPESVRTLQVATDAHGERLEGRGGQRGVSRSADRQAGRGSGDVADAEREGRAAWRSAGPAEAQSSGSRGGLGRCGASGAGWWSSEPDVGRVAHGVPARVDRLRSLGNALVPQIAEWLGRRLLKYEASNRFDVAA